MTQPGEIAPSSARSLGEKLATLEAEIATLKAAQRSPRLPYASLDNSFFMAYNALQQAQLRVGLQSDGTFGILYLPGQAPTAPSAPVLVAGELSVRVRWDGLFAGEGVERPKDFKRIDIHMSQVDGNFTPDGTTLVGALDNAGVRTIVADNDTTWIKLIAVSQSEVASTPTAAVSILPLPISTLAAGSVGAIALAAQIILSTQIIAGDPVGARLVLDALGLSQYDENGFQVLALGPGAAGGNYLLIPDPSGSGATLAGISSTGVLTCTGLAVSGSQTLDGEDIAEIIAGKGGGEVSYFHTASTWTGGTTTSAKGICSLDFTAKAGRSYKVSTSPVLLRGDGSDPYAGVVSGLTLYFTEDGSTVTTSSDSEQGTLGFNDWTHSLNWTYRNNTESDITVKTMLGMRSYGGAEQAVTVEISATNPLEMTVVDSGPIIEPTGVVGAATPPKNYVQTYEAAWSKDFDALTLASAETAWADEIVQGGPTSGEQYVGMFGFDNTDITTDLTGATIQKCELYLTCGWAYNDSGVEAHIGTSTASSEPSTYPTSGLTRDRWVQHFNQPQSRWVNIGTAVGNEFKAGTTNSIILDATDAAFDLANHGTFYEHSSFFYKPKLRISFTR